VNKQLVEPQEPSFGRTLWEAWKAYSHRAGSYQAEVLLSLVYFLVLGPSAIIARLTGTKLLDLSTRPQPSYWKPRPPSEKTLAALERQF
jgi:hypothetical protein